MTQLEAVTEKIKAHVHKPGYIYSFLMTIVRDCFYDANNPTEYEKRDKLITEELMTLLGFWLQCPKPKFSYPDSFEALYAMMIEAEELMNEMHKASYELVIAEMHEMLDGASNTQPEHPSKRLSEEAKAQSIQEAIYYCGDYAYDYEYIHFLGKKYKYDKDWLLQNKSFDVDEAGSIALAIKDLLRKKTDVLCFPDRSMDFKQLGCEDEEGFKMAMEFATFMELIPPFDENSGESDVTNSLHSFCDSLVNLFSLDGKELNGFSGGKTFLDLFSLDLSAENNSLYSRFGDYNVLQAKPIIHLGDGHYLIPLVYQLFVALYETPFYWIMADKHYAKTAGTHRGKAGEDMAYEILSPIFGGNRILRDIEIKDSKHHTITDIDNLCLLGTKAICIQIKSKRLSQASRTGSLQQLTDDFKHAVQDAYEQAILCRKHLVDQSGIFFWSKENQCKVDISKEIDEVYILCLTSENYPALTHQVHELLSIDPGNPAPVVFSVFDLRLITHYLDNPYKFTYYIRQRIQTSSYFYSTNEINYLAFHLLHKLYPNPDYNREVLDNDFATEIDKDYYPFISGRKSNLDTGALKHKWENKRFETLCAAIERVSTPKTADILFFLYDLSSESRDELMDSLDYVKRRSRQNNTVVNIRAEYRTSEEITGITCLALQPFADLYKHMYCLGEMHKYYHKANKWLTLGVYNTSPSLVDLVSYADGKWEENPVLERVCKDNLDKEGRLSQ